MTMKMKKMKKKIKKQKKKIKKMKKKVEKMKKKTIMKIKMNMKKKKKVEEEGRRRKNKEGELNSMKVSFLVNVQYATRLPTTCYFTSRRKNPVTQ